MRLYEFVLNYVGIALEAILLAGLLSRGHYTRCLTLPLYVLSVLVPSVLFNAWPQRFFTWDNYMLREMVHNLLKLAIALEVAYRTFRSFPGALAAGRRLVGIVFLLLAVVALTALTAQPDPAGIQIEWHARMLNGTIWLFTAVALVILWYRLPVDPLHKAILVGFVPYLLVFSVGMRALVDLGWEQARQYQRLHSFAYLVLLGYWNRVAWNRAPAQAVAPRAAQVEQLEPA